VSDLSRLVPPYGVERVVLQEAHESLMSTGTYENSLDHPTGASGTGLAATTGNENLGSEPHDLSPIWMVWATFISVLHLGSQRF
jgi:hypothetical protein